MGRFFKRGKRIASRGLAGFLAALMVVTTVPTVAFESRAEGEESFIEGLLGEAINFGVVADEFTQELHMQTNFAVKHFKNSGVVNDDPDLISAGTEGNVIIPFYAAKIDGTLRLDNFEAKGADRKQVIFYTPYAAPTDKISIKSPSNVTYYLVSSYTEDEIKNTVNDMIVHVGKQSAKLAAATSTIDISSDLYKGMDRNKYVIDVTGLGTVVYINVPAEEPEDNSNGVHGFYDAMAAQGIDIIKNSNQTIVFNLLGDDIYLKQFDIQVNDLPAHYGDLVAGSLISSIGDQNPGNRNDFLSDEVMSKVIWNMPYATNVSIENSCGTYLVPNLTSTEIAPKQAVVDLLNTSTGWLVVNGDFHQKVGEWHFPYATSNKFPTGDTVGDVTLIAYKEYFQNDGVTPAATPAIQAKFGLYTDAACTVPVDKDGNAFIESAQPFNGKDVAFFAIDLPESGQKAVYYIKEVKEADGYMPAVDGVVRCEVDDQGQVIYSHVSGGGVAIVNSYPVYSNKKKAEEIVTGSIVLTKIVSSPSGTGVAWATISKDIQFEIYNSTDNTKVSDPLGKGRDYILGSDLTGNSNGTYSAKITGLAVGKEYRIVETKRLPENKIINGITYTVSTEITSKDSGAKKNLTGAEGPSVTFTELTKSNPDREATFTNTYKPDDTAAGKLTLKKVINAADADAIWKNIAAGDIEFTIKKADGTPVATLTKESFEKDSDSPYRMKADIELKPGTYIIEETKQGLADEDGKIGSAGYYKVVTNPSPYTYKLTVYSNQTYERTFTNTYTAIDPGDIKITKTLTDATWEAVNANIIFTVKDSKGNTVKTIKGDDSADPIKWTEEGTGIYSYILTGLQPGTYTVTETKNGLDDSNKMAGSSTEYTVVTTVDGEAGNEKAVEVTTGKTTGVAFVNAYTMVTEGSLTIKKIAETPDGDKKPTVKDMGANLVFTLTRTDGEFKDLKGNTVTTTTITGGDFNADGSLMLALPNGTYTIEETKNGLNASNVIGENKYESAVTVKSSKDGGVTYTEASVQTITLAPGSKAATVVFKNGYLPELKDITISKRAVSGTEELVGAQLALYEGSYDKAHPTVNRVEEWTVAKGDGPHVIKASNLQRNKDYILVEISAPKGYLVASQIEFQIKESGEIEAKPGSAANIDTKKRYITMFDAAMSTNIELVKTYSDKAITKGLAESAVFELYSDEACEDLVLGDIKPKWSDADKNAKVTIGGDKLSAGSTYYLKEVTAPTGYALSEKVFKCVVAADGKSVTYSVVNGADANNKIVSGKPLCHNVLIYGSVQFAGEKTLSGKTEDGKGVTYHFLAVRQDTNQVAATAQQEGAGKFKFSEIRYTSEDIGKTYVYTIREDLAKLKADNIIGDTRSYEVNVSIGNPDITGKLAITVDPVTSVYSFNNICIKDIQISKKAISGKEELPDATLSLYEGNYAGTATLPAGDSKKVVKDWKSGKTPMTVQGSQLKRNTEYTLVEKAAPAGYQVTSRIVFRINGNGLIEAVGEYANNEFAEAVDKRIITMFDGAISSIKIDKQKAVGAGEPAVEVPGATLSLYEGNHPGKVTGITPVDTWVSSASGAHEIDGTKLKLGTEYTLVEEIAPKGYQIATNIHFSINGSGAVVPGEAYTKNVDAAARTITMFDAVVDDIKIIKTFTGEAIDSALATKAKFGLYDDADCKNCIQTANVQEDDVVRGKYIVVFSGSILKAGATYYLKEMVSPAGYILCEDIVKCEVQENGKVLYSKKAGSSYPAGTAAFPTCENVKDKAVEKTGSITFNGKKKLNGAAPSESYQFVITENNKVIDSASVTGAGKFDFTINYTSDTDVKQHVYEIKEKKGSTPGMKYAETVYTVTVNVADGTSGYTVTVKSAVDEKGVAVKKVDGSELYEFVNTYEANPADIYISKTTVIGAPELPLASLVLYEGNSLKDAPSALKVKDSWTSSDTAHKIDGKLLTYNKEYTLREIGAPQGYKVTTDIIFGIDNDGNIVNVNSIATGEFADAADAPDGKGGRKIVMFDDAIGDISITKVDITTKQELKDAKLSLYEGTYTGPVGDEVEALDSWDSLEGEPHVIKGTLLTLGGTYTLVEKGAPNGYKMATNIVFQIDENGAIKSVGDYPYGEFADAADAPDGKGGRKIVMFDDAIADIAISKLDITGENELSGAVLRLYKGSWTGKVDEGTPVVESWKSTGSAHVLDKTKLEHGKTYTLVEEGAPKGYKVTTNIIFEIAADGSGDVKLVGSYPAGTFTDTGKTRYIAMFDDAIDDIYVSRKKVIGSKELPDATLKVYEGKHPGAVSGLTPIDSWKSTDTAHTIDGTKLKLDTEYTIVEEVAPAGSVIATNIVFKIDGNGDIQPIGTYTMGEFTEATKTGRTITVLDASDDGSKAPEVTPAPTTPGSTTPVISVSVPAAPPTNVDLIIVHKTFDDGKKGTTDNEASGAKFTLFTDPTCKPESAVSVAKDIEAVWMEQHKEWLATFPTGIVPAGQTYYVKETTSPAGYLPDETIYEVIVNTDGKVFYRVRGQEVVTSAMSSRAMIALSSKIKAPKTGNYLDLELPFAIMLLLSAASVFCFVMRKRAEEE